MSEQQQGNDSNRGYSNYRCTGRVGRGIQIASNFSRGRGVIRQHYERNGGRNVNERSNDRRSDQDGGSRDEIYRRNWPKSGIKPDERKSLDAEIESLMNLVKEVNIDSNIKFASKLSPGTKGRGIALLTNYFTFKISESLTIHEYMVDMKSSDPGFKFSKMSYKYRRLIIEQLNKNPLFNENTFIYDGYEFLFSKVKFNFESESNFDAENNCITFEVSAKEYPYEPPASFIVELSHANQYELNPESDIYSVDVIYFLHLLLKNGPKIKNKAYGNEIFGPQRRINFSIGKEMAIGYSMIVHNCESGLLLNVDRVASVFYTSRPVINLFRDQIHGFDKLKSLPVEKVKEIANELKGLRVKVSFPNFTKTFDVSDITNEAASELSCIYGRRDKDGKLIFSEKTPVIEYFQSGSKRLRFPNFPCLVSGDEYFPIEVCELLGDQKVKNDSDLISQHVNKLSDEKACKRFEEISNFVKTIIFDGESYNKQFGVSINPNNVQVNGRLLPAPGLKVANDEIVTPDSNHCWNIQRPNLVFDGVHIKKWIVVYISKDRWKILDDDFNAQFAQKLIEVSQSVGVQMDQPLRIFTHDFVNVDKLKKDIFEKFENLDLIVFIVSRKDNLYNLIKKLAIYEYGVTTQCVSADNFSSTFKDNKLLHYSYLRNLSLQVNSKLNGINWILDVPWTIEMKCVMFIGIDASIVMRPPYSEVLVSGVGTINDNFRRLDHHLSAQTANHDKTVDVKPAIVKLLQSYKSFNHVFPDSVIIYRKAAFQESFPEILVKEVSALKEELQKINCESKISYVCIQKRTDFRMLPLNLEDATSSLTLPAGVVVDTVVTTPALHSFFLCSNIDFKGTGSPPYYSLLYDENELNADRLQQLTHDLSFLHPFGSRAANLPEPVELAKSCLDRARERIMNLIDNELSSNCSPEERLQKFSEALSVHENIEKFLYYI